MVSVLSAEALGDAAAKELLIALVGAGKSVTEEAEVMAVEEVNIDVEEAEDAMLVDVENPD